MKTKIATLLCILFSITTSFAQTFTDNGFDYNVLSTNPNEVEVTGGNDNSSPLIIPSTATDADGIMYTVTTIGNSAYRNQGINGVVLPNTITTISFRAFRDNNGLLSITLPASVTSISSEAFFDGGLNEVIALGTAPASISNSSFGTRSNVDLTVPVGSEETYIAANWTGFRTTNGNVLVGSTFSVGDLEYEVSSNNPNTVSVLSRITTAQSITIPEEVVDPITNTAFDVTVIEDSAFRNTDITAITIGNNIQNIGNQAFRNTNITSIIVPTSVTTIGTNAFNIDTLTQIEALGLTPATIVENSFGDRTTKDLIVPEGTEDAYTSANWTGFRTINGNLVIGDLFSVGDLQYEVTSVNPNIVTVINRVTTAQNITIPETVVDPITNTTFDVTAILSQAFQNTDITTVTIGNTIQNIGANAFNTATLTQIEALGSTPATIVENSFGDRTSKGIVVPNGLEDTYIDAGWAGFQSVNGTSINFEVNGLLYRIISFTPLEVEVTGGTSIPDNLILSGTVTFENQNFTLVDVANGAFESTTITSIILPESLTTIGANAFNADTLTQIEALGTTPATIEANSFGDRSTIDLIVPNGIESVYIAANWTGFQNVNGETPLEVGRTFNVNGLSFRITALAPNELNAVGGSSIPANLVIPETVTLQEVPFTVVGIRNNAFEDKSLTSVVLPPTIRSIGNFAFQSNQISALTLPANLRTIGFRAFRLNQIGVSLIIPNSVTSIGNGAFEQNNFSSLTISENLTVIGDNTFRGNQLTNIIVPNSVITIGEGAFRDNQLTSVSLGNSVAAINDAAFAVNPDLVAVVSTNIIPANITGSNSPFGNIRGSIALTVPFNTLGAYIAAGWTGFASVNFSRVGLSLNLDGLSYRIISDVPFTREIEVVGGTAIPANLVLPESLTIEVQGNNETYTLVSVANTAFQEEGITSVTLSNTIRSIGDFAFDQNALTTIEIPEGVETISQRSFRLNSLTEITIASTVTSIGESAFGANPLATVTAVGITPAAIEALTFGGDRSNIDLFVPVGTEENYLNGGWTGFASITEFFPVGLEFVSNDLLYRITSVTPNEVEVIRGTAIPNDLVLPEIITFENEDFGLVSVGNNAFQEVGLTSVTLPNTIRSIGDFAFDQNSLTTIELPEGLETIGQRSFRLNSLTDITIPSTVVSIGQSAFGGNPLATVTAEGMIPATIGTTTFGGDFSGIDLFIPEGTTQAYLDADWIGFNSITEIAINITVAPKVFLQGASLNPITGEEDLMRDSLRANGLLPTTSPYGDGATVDPTIFTTTGANAIVDWVLVELREGPDNENTTVVNRTAALLQRDGDIVGLDGTSSITFTEEEGTYFVAIIHRNHIGILAAVPVSLSSTATTLDFTQDAAFAKGENLALTTLVNGTFAMIAGDADGSSQILNTDITEALTLAGGGEAYSTADADMNGFVLNSDIQLLVLANSGTVQQFD